MKIPGLTTEEELAHLENLCKAAPPTGHIVELGTFNGRATALMCLATKMGRVITVDNYQMAHHGKNSLAVAAKGLAKLELWPTFLQGDTKTVNLGAHLVRIALLFIDSHHHPNTFLAEMQNCGEYLAEGSIVAVHDVGRPEYPGFTERVLAYFHSEDRWTDEGLVGSLQAWRLEEPWEDVSSSATADTGLVSQKA